MWQTEARGVSIALARHGLRRPCQVEQEQAIREGDRFPWMVRRHDRDLAGDDLHGVFRDPDIEPPLQNLNGDASSLVVLVEGRARAKDDEDQPEGSRLTQCSGVPIAVEE